MKKIIIAISVVIAVLLFALYRVDLRKRQLEAQLINQEFVALLDSIAFSYAPLKLISGSEQDKAEELLHDHLGSSLNEYREFLKEHPRIRAGNGKMIENAQKLYDKTNRTEQSLCSIPAEAAGRSRQSL